MDTVTLELFDLTVSQALLEVQNALDAGHGGALRIVMDDDTLKRNVVKLLNKNGRAFDERTKGPLVTIDVATMKVLKKPPLLRPAQVPNLTTYGDQAQAAPLEQMAQAARAATPPVLVVAGAIGAGDKLTGRRLLLEVLRRADKSIPWVGIASEGATLLRDPDGLKTLQGLKSSGVRVRVSRECAMFNPDESAGFDVMEDSEWQGLLLKGKVTTF